MRISFDHCGQAHAVDDCSRVDYDGFLKCPECRTPLTNVDISAARDWIEAQVDRKRQLAAHGQLASRKQARQRDDGAIDRDGLSAELAACVILCPRAIRNWQRAAERGGENRGRDLPARWTGLDRPVEVKHTLYHDERRGFLLIRPPRRTPGPMKPEFIDDAFYVLLTGQPFRHTLLGWTDREHLLRDGVLNPVPVGAGQRETWGLHWSQLRPMDELAARVTKRSWWRCWLRELWDSLR